MEVTNKNFPSESFIRTLSFLCEKMKNKKHLTPLPLCTQLTSDHHPDIQLETVNANNSEHSDHAQDMFDDVQNVSMIGLLAGTLFILVILVVVSWNKVKRKRQQVNFLIYLFKP